jgi:phosphate transport system substrate-binding protein
MELTMPRLGLTTALASFLMLASAADAATIAIHGSTTVANAVLMPHKAQIEQSSGETLDIVANGSGRGLADLQAGKADMAMISAPLATEAASANAKTPGSVDPAKLVAHQIGEAKIAFVVNATNPVKQLTLAQIGDILSGKITKWSEVGGPDQPIVIVAAGPGDGVRSVVEARLLGGASIPAHVREMTNAPQIAQVTAQLPTAFGVTSAASVWPDNTVLTTDQSIGQPLSLVTMGPPSPDATKVIDAAIAAAK